MFYKAFFVSTYRLEACLFRFVISGIPSSWTGFGDKEALAQKQRPDPPAKRLRDENQAKAHVDDTDASARDAICVSTRDTPMPSFVKKFIIVPFGRVVQNVFRNIFVRFFIPNDVFVIIALP